MQKYSESAGSIKNHMYKLDIVRVNQSSSSSLVFQQRISCLATVEQEAGGSDDRKNKSVL